MAKYKKAVITNAGLDMLSRSILQSGAVTFTKMEIGAGEYQEDEDLLNSTGLKMPKQSCSITQATVVDGNTVKIQSRISNDEVKVGYYIREVGIYAQLADEEKLISINLAEPEYTDYLPDKDTAPVTVIYDIYLQIKNCNQINFNYTCPADVYALKADVDESLEQLQKPIYNEAEDLAELTSGEEHITAWGKVKKAIKELISHIGTDATANKGGHVRLSSSSAVTDSTGLALPATEKNASLEGTMAQQIAALNKSFASRYLGMQVNNCIMNGFMYEASFVNGECEAPLEKLGLAGCNTDDWYLLIIFGNNLIDGKLEQVSWGLGSENGKVKIILPLNPSYNGTVWINGLAIASHK